VLVGALGSAEFVAVELAAVTDIVADTCGSLARPAALAAAVKRTEVTVVAEAATAIVACSSRWADFASSAPRSHDALPSWLPQPKLNTGVRLAGAAVRRMVASGTLPPCAQAVTVHRAVCPRWMLEFAGCTATQRLTCAGCAVGVLVVVGSVVVADVVGFADVVAFGEALEALVAVVITLEVLVCVVVLAVEVLVCVVVGVAVVVEVLAGVTDDLAVAVAVLGLADVDAFEDGVELEVAVEVCVEGEGSVLAVGDFEALAVAVGVLEVLAVGSLVDGDGLGEVLEVAVGVGVGVGEEVDADNGWHCWTAPVDAASPAAWAAGAASENPEAAAARTPPVTTPATTGCTCAIRMKGPAQCCSSLQRNGMPCSCRTPPLDTNDGAQC
jgi:hypothetical protein